MGKTVFILKGKKDTEGVAKITAVGNRKILSVNLRNNSHSKKTCLVKSGNECFEIGNFYKKRVDFEIPSDLNVESISILEDGSEVFWSSKTKESCELFHEHEPKQEEITFDNFLGGGFEWTRIRGNFVVHNYSIIHHILSLNNVYRSINKAGYYSAGVCEKNDIKIIAIAIPLIKDISNPFSGVSADVYKIKHGKTIFDVLCVGIDRTGEFFISN